MRKMYLKKADVYKVIIGLGLLAPLVGDQSPAAKSPEPAAAPAASAVQINPDHWQSLASAVRRQARRFPGDAAYIIKDFRTGQVVTSNADHIFPSASLIKLPILCAAFEAVQEGRISLNTPIILQRADLRGGSGVLKRTPVGSVLTNRELLEDMIIYSDNTAAELIIRQLGYEYLQATFTQLGLRDTEIHPDGFRLKPRSVPDDNITSPRDMAFLLEKIYDRRLVSAEASDQMLDILKHQHLRDRLPRFLPTGWEIAHKTGLLRKACHDVGIVFSPDGDYMICVLTAHDATYKMAKRFIASMGRITFDYYQGAGARLPVLQSRLPDAPAGARAS